jgi:glycosyltransferase involved in cell wall biosynthesis
LVTFTLRDCRALDSLTGWERQMGAPLRIVLLTSDNRECQKDYANPQPHFGTAPEALIQGFAELSGVEVDVVCCVRAPMDSPTHLTPNIRYHALLVPKVGWMTTGYTGCIRAVRRKLRDLRPDMVHGQGTERDCAITAVFSGFPNVLTIHGNMRIIAEVNRNRPFSYGWLNAYLEAFTIPRAHGVVCITHYTATAVHDLARRTWLVPNAVDARYFDVCPAPTTPPLVLCVGLVCHRKNQNRFIRSLDGVAARMSLRVRFLGEIPPGDSGAEFRSLLESRPWCEHGGFVERAALAGELSHATLLALPSLEDNCPMAIIEAMAAGVPVAAARVGGVPDLVEEGATGVLFDPLDEASMSGAVEALLGDARGASRMGAAGREEALRRFTPRVVAERHVEIYREVLNASA